MEIPNHMFFVATFADGSQIFQNAQDRSEQYDERNCYFDVRVKATNVADNADFEKMYDHVRQPLRCFVLAGKGYYPIGVDLIDGHFEVNGVPFFQHSEPYRDFKLLYFRNVAVHRTLTVTANGPTDEAPRDSYDLGYILGWEVEHNGEKVQRIIRV